MSEPISKPHFVGSVPEFPIRCPQCGRLVNFESGVVTVRDTRTWVDEWSCPVHGVLQSAEERLE